MGTSYNPKIVVEGLNTMLDFGNVKSYAGVGTIITDLSGNGNHASSANVPSIDSANQGSMIFDGTSDYINLASTLTQEDASNTYTVTMAAKLSSISASRRQLLSSDNGGYDWGIGAGDSSKYIVFTGEASATATPQDLDWHIFTVQWTGTSVKLYIDGSLEVDTAISFDPSISAITAIGRNPVYGGGSEYWHGNVAFMLKYTTVLTDAEITKNFNALRGRFGL